MLAAEVGGQWSEETALFLGALAKARAQESTPALAGRFVCSLARSITESLLEQGPVPSVGEDAPSVHEVPWDARFV